ncbi:MAG: DUF1592 domain-containing protein [Verrucomicrobiales bacterium]|nr:DUF1592 domain-containing protein [Verrucomicrobiales bacterium]
MAAFMDRHCVDCHDADVKKGGLDLEALQFDLTDAEAFRQWQRIYERVRDHEMPPSKKPQPTQVDADVFLAGLQAPLTEADAADIAAKGRVHSRRLTRTEYEHTLHDLLGIDMPLKDLLPEDRASRGFETVSAGQQQSDHLLARYLDVADLALDAAFTRALEGEETFKRFYTPQDLVKNRGGNYRGPDLRNGESIAWPIGLQFFGRTPTFVPESGWYRVTLKNVRAINAGPKGAVWGTLRSGECEANAPLLFMVGLVEATPEPRDMVFEAWIQKGHRLEMRPNDGENRLAPSGAKGGNVSFNGRDLASEGFPGIAHRGIQIERFYPNADRATLRRNLFGDVDPKAAKPGALDRLVTRFAQRAFRRPVTEEQTAAYREIGHKSLADGDSLAESLRACYRAILCSPRFLTFVEAPGPLDDYAIASRLSYALWVSMPDQQLIQSAKEGKLKQPVVMAQQIERMLADPKAERFIKSFTDQWLKLNLIDFTTPDPRQFRTFDTVLQQSLLQETRAYFTEMLRNDLGVTHFIDSDFAFLNGRLARHYGSSSIPAAVKLKPNGKKKQVVPAAPTSVDSQLFAAVKPGDGLQRVSLPAGSLRGGLLTQGAVLKVTADGTSTSPVIRGVFINERILGNEIPPPPPGIPAIEPDIRGATSIRDQLAKHRNNDSCASCHKTIDPPGFALEAFDPVGVWRKNYGKVGVGAAIDPSGTTPDGVTFSDLREWKQIYLRRGDQLARGFIGHFLTYASGAAPRFSDEATIRGIVDKTEKSAHGLRSLIREVLMSTIYLEK